MEGCAKVSPEKADMIKFKIDIKFIMAVTILFLCNILLYKNIFFTPVVTPHVFTKEFSSRISNRIATDVVYDKDVISSLDPDKTVYKTYYNKQGSPITLFMACYSTLEKADLSHSPVVCFTGQGWEISKTGKQEINIGIPVKSTIKVNQLIQNKLETTMITLYWYQSADNAFSDRGFQKILLFFNKIFEKPVQNAFVRVTATVPPDGSVNKTASEVYSFVKDIYPELLEFFN